MASGGSKNPLVLVLLAAPVDYVLARHEPTGSGIDPDLGQPSPRMEAAAAPEPAPAVNLGSLERCGCKLADANNYRQPDGCRLRDKPNLVGVEGYLKTGDREVDNGGSFNPWIYQPGDLEIVY